MKKIFFVLAIFICGKIFSQTLNVIPAITDVKFSKGNFYVNEKTTVKFPASFKNEGRAFIQMVKNVHSISLKETTTETENVIDINNELPGELITGESYHSLNISEKKISVNSPSSQGAFCGLMSLLQLMNSKKMEIPCCELNDKAAYSWRGMHLDVSRHFFPKDFIKKYIDLLAIYKMNTFHWHLTDDQGWRIEIKKYPKLTQIGSRRKGSMIGHYNKQRYDTISYGGFYTQEDIKEIVAYAAARQVTIVPEIEMPGHSVAALSAYPQLACKDSTFEVAKGWGVFDDVYCTKEETFKFLEDVLSEVCDLFPGQYIHIGGDECPKTRWKNCAKCQARIKSENLKNEDELQSYFVKRMEKFVNSKGKQIIGWDEILDGGLAPNAAVMSWRGTEGGEAAAKQNHYVVMTPGAYCYFDHYQCMPEFEPTAIGGFTSLQKVYSFDPTPRWITAEQKKYILGAQGNVWTEYINTPKDVEYMALPRMCALAEVLWCPKAKLNWNDFTQRLMHTLTLLDKMNVNYCKSNYLQYKTQPKSSMDGYDVVLTSQLRGTIRYTTDGTDPDNKSAEYKNPFSFDKTTTVKAGLFVDGKLTGRILEKQFIVSLASGRKIVFNTKSEPESDKNLSFILANGILESASAQQQNCIKWKNDAANFTIDLGASKTVKKVTLYFLQDGKNFIIQPKAVTVFYTTDGSRYEMAGKTKFSYSGEDYMKMEITFEPFTSNLVKVRADNPGKMTAGKLSHNQDLWLYLDEVVIE